ncbi:MAG: helix-turn-helix transcriptional regulator [Oscillospiraceae bacterium]|nr:helix-turn-helix transcriptional regulator [Oscillospiraceae bacterium]
MEKRTIGSLIAALRKANGMTQKDLAAQLNVSDKTISRWERDDGTPDLSLIPVIAEIFHVTCDELLRGERKSPEERTGQIDEAECSPKGEKQRQRLLKAKLSQYQTLTYISMGISTVGIIAALICNLAFLKAVLGFLLGAIFYVASIVYQSVFRNQTLLSVEDAGLDALALSGFKRSVNEMAQKSIGLTVACIGFTFPLVLVDAYMGLGTDSLLIFGGIGAAVFLSVYALIVFCINSTLLRKVSISLMMKRDEATSITAI